MESQSRTSNLLRQHRVPGPGSDLHHLLAKRWLACQSLPLQFGQRARSRRAIVVREAIHIALYGLHPRPQDTVKYVSRNLTPLPLLGPAKWLQRLRGPHLQDPQQHPYHSLRCSHPPSVHSNSSPHTTNRPSPVDPGLARVLVVIPPASFPLLLCLVWFCLVLLGDERPVACRTTSCWC